MRGLVHILLVLDEVATEMERVYLKFEHELFGT